MDVCPTTADLLPAEARDPRVHRPAYRAHYHTVQALPPSRADVAEPPRRARDVPDRCRRAGVPYRVGVTQAERRVTRPVTAAESRARQPALVGHRRRRLPGRARRVPGRRRLRLVPGGPARGRRPPARRRRRPAGAGGRLRRRGRRPLARHPGRRRGRARPVRRHAAARRRRAADASGVRVPLVQADALALPFADAAFDIAFTAFGAVPFVDDSAARDARGAPGPAPGRPLGLLGHPPDALDLPRRPRRGRPGRRALVLRPPALRRVRRRRHAPPTSNSTAPSATGSASWSAAGFALRRPDRAGVAGRARRQIWGQWSPLRGRLFPGTAIFVTDKPPG